MRSYEKALQQLGAASTELERFYELGPAAMAAYESGNYLDAKRFAEELKRLTPNYQNDWNYGNAIHTYHSVLGRLAILENDLELASQHLLAAGRTPGSPQLDSFGPNMSLAKELLEQHRVEETLTYFELCQDFWEMDKGQLSECHSKNRANT